MVRDGRVLGAVALEDAVREESRQAIDALHERGVKVAMITGDARQVADAVAADLGIDEAFADVLPENKDAEVAALQARGHRVAMVGDGVNDAPALARADVGVAIGAGTDVAIESAGVVLAADDPRAVLSIIDLSQASYRKMWQNLVWATGYNVIAVPLAAGVLAFAGVAISPGGRRDPDVRLHHRRRPQRAAAAPTRSGSGTAGTEVSTVTTGSVIRCSADTSPSTVSVTAAM